jgi:hypothetical protein
MICLFNKDDKARLAKEIITKYNLYVGMRDDKEFEASKHLFDVIICVDGSERIDYIDKTFKIDKNQADFIVYNNGTLEEFKNEIKNKLGHLFQN